MSAVSFCKPVYHTNPQTLTESLRNQVEGYFDFRSSSAFATVLKIISIFTLIVPLAALLAKAFLRYLAPLKPAERVQSDQPPPPYEAPPPPYVPPQIIPSAPEPKRVTRGEIQKELADEIGRLAGDQADSNGTKCVLRAIAEIIGNAVETPDKDHIFELIEERLNVLVKARSGRGAVYLNRPVFDMAMRALNNIRAKSGPVSDAERCKNEFQDARRNGDDGRVRRQNGVVFQETLRALQDGTIPKEVVAGAIDRTLRITESPVIPQDERGKYPDVELQFVNESTFDHAERMIQRGLNPLIMNMASGTTVGGAPGFASAQEENLFRRSTLPASYLRFASSADYATYAQKGSLPYAIPLGPTEGVLTQRAIVFRGDEETGYAYLKHPFECDVFGIAAFNRNKRHLASEKGKPPGEQLKNPEAIFGPANQAAYRELTKAKLRLMFRVAHEKGNDSLLLSAFGCGAFDNRPEEIAHWMKEVLGEDEFKGAFRAIHFAITDKGRTDNLRIFRQVFARQ